MKKKQSKKPWPFDYYWKEYPLGVRFGWTWSPAHWALSVAIDFDDRFFGLDIGPLELTINTWRME